MSGLPFTAFDILVVSVVLVSALVALGRGLVAELFGLIGWVGAAVVGWFAYPILRPVMLEAIGQDLVADLATALLVFLIPLLVFRVVGGMVANGLAGLGMGAFDRVLGLAFGLARGGLIVSTAYLIAMLALGSDAFPPWVTRAFFEPPVRVGAQTLAGFLPADIAAQGRRTVDGALERAQEGRATPPAASPAPPPPQQSPPRPGQPGYKPEERREMDRLIEQVR